jgi:peptide/nickel transport system permease protein
MLRAILRRPTGLLSLGTIGFVALLALLGRLLAPYDPYDPRFTTLLGPSLHNPLGTDYLGRDELSRLLHGSALSVLGAAEVVIIGLALGVIPGILSVFLGRGFEWISLRLSDTLIALPSLLFAVAVTTLIGNGLSEAMLVVGILIAPHFYRVARAAALEVTGQAYVEASLLMGASVFWVLRQHVWAKVLPAVAIAIATNTGYALIAVSTLTFLGIGVQPPEPTWGGMIASDLLYLAQKPYGPIFPSLLIVMTVASFNLLADTMRDVQRRGTR